MLQHKDVDKDSKKENIHLENKNVGVGNSCHASVSFRA